MNIIWLAILLYYAFCFIEGLPQLSLLGNGGNQSSVLIPDIPENYDVNGKLSAGLLIVSDISGLSYSVNNDMWKKVLGRFSVEDFQRILL